MKFTFNQLDSGDLNGYLSTFLLTGVPLRHSDTGNFLTETYLNSNQNFINGYLFSTSGSISQTGMAVMNLIDQISIDEELSITGQTVLSAITGTSGFLNSSGLYLSNVITGLSGAFNKTGLDLSKKFESLSGSLNNSGLNLQNLITGLSGQFNQSGLNLVKTITGESGAFNVTGLNLIKTITGLSGALNQTGMLIFNSAGGSELFNTGQLVLSIINGVSGVFNNSGEYNKNGIFNLSGDLKTTGLNLANVLTGISGAFNITGLDLVNLITGLSGAFIITGISIKDQTRELINGQTKVAQAILSGAVTLFGQNYTIINKVGNTLHVGVVPPEEAPGRVISLNVAEWLVTLTGQQSLSNIQNGSGILISGSGSGGEISQDLYYSFGTNDLKLSVSGGISARSESAINGLALLNSVNGELGITGRGAIIFSDSTVNISGTKLITTQNKPAWFNNHPDLNYINNNIDDDFTGLYLDPKWINLNDNTSILNSGIANSHFYFTSDSRPSTMAPVCSFVQNVTTGEVWEFKAKMNIIPKTTERPAAGLIVRNSSSNIEKLYGMTLTSAASPQEAFFLFSHTGAGNLLALVRPFSGFYGLGYSPIYFRIRYSGGFTYYDTSVDDFLWRNVYTENYPILTTINQVGFFNQSRIIIADTAVDWFKASGLS